MSNDWEHTIHWYSDKLELNGKSFCVMLQAEMAMYVLTEPPNLSC